MSKERVLNRIEQEWESFLQSFAGLTNNRLMEPNVVGHWSVRDVLAHITTWEEEALKALPVILDGKSPPRYKRYGGINAFNAQEQEKKRHLALEQVQQELVATHRCLLNFLIDIPESVFSAESRLQRRLRLDTYRHYREHTDQLTNWRRQL